MAGAPGGQIAASPAGDRGARQIGVGDHHAGLDRLEHRVDPPSPTVFTATAQPGDRVRATALAVAIVRWVTLAQ
jgi:hypothetical protein